MNEEAYAAGVENMPRDMRRRLALDSIRYNLNVSFFLIEIFSKQNIGWKVDFYRIYFHHMILVQFDITLTLMFILKNHR